MNAHIYTYTLKKNPTVAQLDSFTFRPQPEIMLLIIKIKTKLSV